LLARGAQVDHRQNGGGTELLMAALNGCAEAVRNLLDDGADIDDTDNQGRSPLT
jgi:ankyrin repeat protein